MIPPLDVYSRGIKTCVHKKNCIRMFIAALFITAKKKKKENWKKPMCPSTGKWKTTN